MKVLSGTRVDEAWREVRVLSKARAVDMTVKKKKLVKHRVTATPVEKINKTVQGSRPRR